jgi:hypothetical protein
MQKSAVPCGEQDHSGLASTGSDLHFGDDSALEKPPSIGLLPI